MIDEGARRLERMLLSKKKDDIEESARLKNEIDVLKSNTSEGLKVIKKLPDGSELEKVDKGETLADEIERVLKGLAKKFDEIEDKKP